MSSDIPLDSRQSVKFSTQQTLPPALIQRIFLLVCIPCHRRPQKCKRPGCSVSSALILGKICRAWRDVAWNTPALWRWIDITASLRGYTTQENLEIQSQLLREWLQRAKGQLLSINVRPEKGYGNYPHPGPIAIFKILADHSMQWKELDVLSSDDCTQALNAARGRIPFLESLVINTSGVIIHSTTLDFLADASNLRSLDCTTLRLGQDGNPWPRLTSLTARGDVNGVAPLLRFAPNLEYCRLEGVYRASHLLAAGQYQSPSSGTSLPISLQYLKSLVIKQCDTVEFLTQIEAPSLQRLSIIHGFSFSFEPIVRFIDRTNCKLRALGVATDSPFDVEGLQSLLSRSDHVTRLYVGSKKASDYQALMHKIPRMLDPDLSGDDGKGDILLPNLQILYYSTIDPVRSEDMINMIKHRWNGNVQVAERSSESRVAKLRIARFKKTNLKILLDPLKAEIEQGLEVTYDLPYKGEPFE